MYKSILSSTGEEIIILHPHWRGQIERLREMDHADLLVCQGCNQPVRVKAGEVKRPHFAHKHLKACSYANESPEILNARATLYEWLLAAFGPGAVTLEKQVEDLSLPRAFDCWVEMRGRTFAYWIIEAGIRLEPRIEIKRAFETLGTPVHPVFLSPLLNEKKEVFHSLLLSPTERAFMFTTAVDEMLAGPGRAGGSLHYLNLEDESLTTYRGLEVYHRPNWYKGTKKTAPLAVVRPSPEDGIFLYPGEIERLGAYRKKQSRLEQKRKEFSSRESEWKKHLSDRPGGWNLREDPLPPSLRSAPADPEMLPLTCVTCGKETVDYWATFYDETGRKMCRCRECLVKGIA